MLHSLLPETPMTLPRKQSANSMTQRFPSAGGLSCQDTAGGYMNVKWEELHNLTYMTKGAMCEIYTADLHGIKVAVKTPRPDYEDLAVAEHDLEVELDVLKGIEHKHIIKLLGAGMKELKPHRFLVLEFLDGGTLATQLEEAERERAATKLEKKSKKYLAFRMKATLVAALALAEALEYLHHQYRGDGSFVIHRDLKPDNVGYSKGTLKLFDFGLARCVVRRAPRMNARYEMTGETGSMRYMAPEVVESLPYNEKVDVYAFGLLLWEMLQARRVFDGMSVSEFYKRVVNAGARPSLDPTWPEDIRKLISLCWHADVDRRPDFHQIVHRLSAYVVEDTKTNRIAQSALNLRDDSNMLKNDSHFPERSATATRIFSFRGSSATAIVHQQEKKHGEEEGLLKKLGRIIKGRSKPKTPKGGDAAASQLHIAPEALRPSSRHSRRSLSDGLIISAHEKKAHNP